MRVIYRHKQANWNQKLLCVAHTSREFNPALCTLNAVDERLKKPERLNNKQPFESLSHIKTQRPYDGNITIWDFPNGDLRSPHLIAQIRPDSKPQYASWYQHKLWILCDDVLEVYNTNLKLIKCIRDPWLAGTHTIVPDYKGHLIISCAASDSILFVDETSYEVVRAMRLPEEIYGANYSLSRTDSVVEHYIPFDLHLAHINGAWPQFDDVLISTWRGAIGRFDKHGKYSEIIQGFAGCHGVRTFQNGEGFYFCDSCLGTILFLTKDNKIYRRVATDSKWLRDAQQLNDRYFILSLTDKNCLQVMDVVEREVVHSIPCDNFGSGTELLYYGGNL